MTDYNPDIDAIEQDIADGVTELKQTTKGYGYVKPFPPGPKTHWGMALSFLDAAGIKLEGLRQKLQPTTPPPPPPPASSEAGLARFYQHADSSCDSWYGSATDAQKQAMNDHYSLVTAWSPWADARVPWLTGPKHIVYMDCMVGEYARKDSGGKIIPPSKPWILKDAQGNPITFYSWNQWLADISSPEFRADYIARAKAVIAKGYDGIFIDDANTVLSDTSGTPVGIDLSKWTTIMADFMGEVRAALPGAFLVQNTPWFKSGGNSGNLDPEWKRMIGYCDVVDMERGFNDTNIVGGTGPSSVFAALRWIDIVHSLGAGVIVQSQSEPRGDVDLAYNLAGYFLASNGKDFVGSSLSRTASWYTGYDVELGDPKGDRTKSGDLYRREFTNGYVELDAAARTGKVVVA